MKFFLHSHKEMQSIILAFILIAVITIISQLYGFFQINTMNNITADIYQHPLQVSNASLRIKGEIYKIQLDMKALLSTPTNEELPSRIQDIDTQEQHIYEDLRIIEKNILGSEGRRLESETAELMKGWKPIRDDIIGLLENNHRDQAIVLSNTKNNDHVDKLENSASQLYNHAREKATGFKKSSISLFEELLITNIMTSIALLSLFFMIAYFTVTRIRKYIFRISHLTAVLSVIRDVNQLIVREKNRQTLIQGCCDILISNRTYANAWIILYDEDNHIAQSASSDNSDAFIAFKKKLESGWVPHCVKQTERSGVNHLLIRNTKESCNECALMDIYESKGAYTVQLMYDERLFGYLTLSIDTKYLDDTDEHSLLHEVGGDIAYALYNLEREKKLRVNEERYRFAVEATRDGVWDWNIATGDVYISPRWKALLGYRDDELENSFAEWEVRIHPDDKEKLFEEIENAQKIDAPLQIIVHRIKHKNGDWIWMASHIRVLFDENNQPLRMIGADSDITEEKKHEAQLLAMKELYENIINSIENLLFVKNTDYIYIVCNQAFAKFVGKPHDEIVGKSDYDIFEKDVADFFRENDQKMIADRRTRVNFEWVTYPDGAKYYLQTLKSPLLNSKGKIIGLVGNSADMTEEKKLEDALRLSNEKFQKAFNQSPDIIMITNLKTGEIYEVNETFEKITEYTREEVIGKNTFDIGLWKNNRERDQYINSLLKNDFISGIIYQYKSKNGKFIQVRASAGLIEIENETYILTIAEDITAEKALEIENRQFIHVLNQTINEIHVFRLDDFHFTYANNSALTALGYTLNEMKQLTPVDIAGNIGSVEDIRKVIKPLLEGKVSRLYIETEHIRKDGTLYPTETRLQLIELENVRYGIAMSLDISDKKRSEEALKKSQEDYKLLTDNVLDLIWKMNMDFEFTYVNPAIETILGFSAEEFVGTKLYEHCSKEEFAKIEVNISEMIRSKTHEGVTLEAVMYRKDGSEITAQVNGKLIFDNASNPIGIQGSARDFTAQAEGRKKLADAVGELEKKSNELQTILQEAPNPIMLHNENGAVLMVNNVWESLSGYSYDEIDTLDKWMDKACKNNKSVLRENMDKIYSLDHKTDIGESTITTKTGDTLIWQISSAPLGFIDGKRTVVTSAMDITELKKKDELMMIQSRHAAMGEMIGMIAHQWRQPIAGIAMDANNMLLDIGLETFDCSAAEVYANDILNQTQHLSKTIDDFRNFFKPEKAIVNIGVKAIIDETYAIVKDSLKNHGIGFTVSNLSESEVPAYPRELMQVFVNIINNAKDSLILNRTQNPSVEIKIYEDEKYVNTQICDNGIGIDKSIFPKLFDPYFTTKDEKTGTGLGLYMSKMIIEDHLHGMIEASNQEHGACFTVKLLKSQSDGQ